MDKGNTLDIFKKISSYYLFKNSRDSEYSDEIGAVIAEKISFHYLLDLPDGGSLRTIQ